MPSPKPNPLLPVVRVAPLGELNAYAVYEHELDTLARGSSGANLLNISYALIPFSGAFVIAIFGTEIPSNRVFTAFILVALVTGLAGLICLLLGIANYQSNKALVAEIKRRMPPPATPATAPLPATIPPPPVPPTSH
jgi:hypothetical protein